jgi:formylglycine-generating enzyme required for sulfatase activity
VGDGSVGSIGNFANYGGVANWNNLIGNITSVGTNGSSSYLGTYDQSGNVWEWNDSVVQSSYRVVRGGAYNSTIAQTADLSSVSRKFSLPTSSVSSYGFRVCCKYPLPSNNSLIEFIPVYAANVPADSSSFGSVSYNYYISRYLITNYIYSKFLLAVGANDTYGIYAANMGSNNRGGINSNFTVKNNMANKPVNYISWFMAARFVNWLHNGMTTGVQNSSTTENGAYLLNGATSGISISKNSDANYWIPSEDEWYKAAYYSPNP